MNGRKKRQGGGIGGILEGLSSFIDFLSKMEEEGETEVRREGEFGSEKEGFKAVYGVSVRILGEGRPIVERFGNVREKRGEKPVVEEVREPLVDVFDEKDIVRVVVEMPGVEEKNIKCELEDDVLIISAEKGERKYYKEVLLPAAARKEKMTSSYRNGILEVRIVK